MEVAQVGAGASIPVPIPNLYPNFQTYLLWEVSMLHFFLYVSYGFVIFSSSPEFVFNQHFQKVSSSMNFGEAKSLDFPLPCLEEALLGQKQ